MVPESRSLPHRQAVFCGLSSTKEAAVRSCSILSARAPFYIWRCHKACRKALFSFQYIKTVFPSLWFFYLHRFETPWKIVFPVACGVDTVWSELYTGSECCHGSKPCGQKLWRYAHILLKIACIKEIGPHTVAAMSFQIYNFVSFHFISQQPTCFPASSTAKAKSMQPLHQICLFAILPSGCAFAAAC